MVADEEYGSGMKRSVRTDGGETAESSVDGTDRFETRTIEVKAPVYERFEREREKTKNEHIPAMSPTVFLSSLLDTQQAARDGYSTTEGDQ